MILQRESVVLKSISSLNLLAGDFIFLGEFLGLLNHTLDFFFREPPLVVSDGDRFFLAGTLVASGDPEDAVCVELEGYFDLGDASGSGGDAG